MNKKNPKTRLMAAAFTLSLICSILFISCQEEESAHPVKEAEESQSEISLIEQETGLIFFKRDLTLTDDSGENKVTIRIAGVDESMVDEYIKYRVFSITPIYNRDAKPSQTQILIQPDESSVEYDNSYESTVVIEVVDEKLAEGVVAVGLRNGPNPAYKFDQSGRTKYFNQAQHTSGNWPSVLAFQAAQQVQIVIGFKNKWYSSWNPVYGPETWCCNQFRDFDVDGPYRARLDIAYNYYGDYYFEWFY